MLTFASKYGYNKFSQNSEDGIIQECIKRIQPSLLRATEFGGCDGFYCSNTALLREQGWQVDMYDIKPGSELVMKCEITPENVNQVVRPCSVLSIDCDGPDYGIWEAYEGKPDIVIIEINSSILPEVDEPVNDPQRGTAFRPMCQLANKKGYFLLCHTGNCIFILDKHMDLFPEVDGVHSLDKIFNRSFL